MTAMTPITLAGGLKALRIKHAVPRAPCPVSPAFTAFASFCEAMDEACAAEALRASAAAWDVALGDADAAAEHAVNNAMDAARFAGDAPILLAPDRRLIFAARFIHCALGIENTPDRNSLLHFIDTNRGLWGGDAAGLTARRAEALMDLAVGRLLKLIDLMDNGASSETLTSP